MTITLISLKKKKRTTAKLNLPAYRRQYHYHFQCFKILDASHAFGLYIRAYMLLAMLLHCRELFYNWIFVKMANTLSVQTSLMIILILSAFVINLEGISYQGRKLIMQERIDSRSLSGELGYDLSKLKHSREVLTDRISPGGPDPHHHSQPTPPLP